MAIIILTGLDAVTGASYPVLVNTDNINFAKPDEGKAQVETVVSFVDGAVWVKESVQEIADRISKADK